MSRVIWSPVVDDALSRYGSPLFENGVKNWAIPFRNSYEIIDELLRNDIVLLGGDIWEKIDSNFRMTGDSWYYDYNVENKNSCAESIKVARDYIDRLKNIFVDKYISFVPLILSPNQD